jgi:hypothetical protein
MFIHMSQYSNIFQSTSSIPIGSPTIPNTRFSIGWNVHSGSRDAPSNTGGNNVIGGSNIPWGRNTFGSTHNPKISNPFGSAYVPRGNPLGGIHGPQSINPFKSVLSTQHTLKSPC